MSRKLFVTCDNCEEVFNVKYQQRIRPGGVLETYFKCKQCKKKYFCFATDVYVRKLQSDIKSEESPFKRHAMQLDVNARMNKLKEQIKN